MLYISQLFLFSCNKKSYLNLTQIFLQLGLSMGPSQSQVMGNQPQVRDQQRFLDHPNLQTNEVITHRIMTDDVNLYFQPHNQSHNFKYLSQQYQMYKKKPLVLSNSKVSFPPYMPVGQLDKNFQLEKAIQQILNILQKQESEHQKIDESKLKQVNELIQQKSLALKSSIKDSKKLQKGRYKQIKLRINYFGSRQIITQPFSLDIKGTYNQMIDELYNIMNTIEKDQNAQNKQGIQQSSSSIKSMKDANNKFIQIYDHDRNIVNSDKHNQSIYSKIENQITVLFHSGVCQFLDKSKLLQYKDNKFVQISLEKAVQNKDNYQIAALNIKNRQITHSPFFQLQRKDTHPKHFFRITLQAEQISQKKQIYFHRNQLVLNQHLDWIRVQLLQIGMNIYGVSGIKIKQAILLTITLISPISLQIDSTISISSPNYLNIVIDGIIVHNQNQIKIFCNEINQRVMQRYQKPVFLNKTFNDYFAHNQPCFYAGHQINKNQTFSDYCLKDKDQIYIKKCKQINFRELTISIKKTQNNIVNYTIELQSIQNLFHELKFDYLGVWNNNVISFSQKKLEELFKINELIHIIGEKSGYLSKLHFFQNNLLSSQKSKKSNLFQVCKRKYPVFFAFQQLYIKYQNLQRQLNKAVIFQQEDLFPIYLYTTDKIYPQMNNFLRCIYEKVFVYSYNYKMSQEQWVPITNWIMKSIQILPNYQGKCYRGIKDVKLDKMFAIKENNQTVCCNGFYSTSCLKQIVLDFSNNQGIIMTIISKTGKLIAPFSRYPEEGQVLFPPFTNFMIISYNERTQPQTILLEEILVSKSKTKNLLFWVDDQPKNNQKQAKIFENNQIQVIEVTSTIIMEVIMKRFYRSYKILGKKMAIISDMVRLQNLYLKDQSGEWIEQRKENKQAGMQLLKLIYKNYGLTVKSFIYTSPQYVEDIQSTIKKEELPSDKISVIGYRFDLIEKISNFFQVD